MIGTRARRRQLAISSNVGRPRTALVIGRDVAAVVAHLQQKGAATVVEAAISETASDARFDAVVLADAEPINDVAAALRFAREKLGEGGHVVGLARLKEDLDAAATGAGLELMRVDRDPKLSVAPPIERMIANAAPALFAAEDEVFVARRKPPRGPLSLTVGMLTLDEEESVARMIDDVRATAPDAKILLVDSSADRTPDIAREKGARVVRQLPARGHGPAMERLMYEAALESDALIYLDCDFTYPTREIVRLRELLEDGADVVNASRTWRRPDAMPMPNFFANRVFAAVAHAVHGVPTTDVHSGMRAYRSSVIRAFDFDGEGDALPLDTLILPARSGYRVVETPIEYNERVGVSKLAKLRGTVWTFIRIGSALGRGVRVGRASAYSHRS